jgi:acyl carrier protein
MTGGLSETDLMRMTRHGIIPMSAEEGLGLFDLARTIDQAVLVAMRVDAAAIRAQARTGLLPTLLRGLVHVPARRAVDGGSLARRLAGVPDAEWEGVVLELVRSEVALVLGHSSFAAIDPDRAFKDLGFDSLAAVELRNRLNTITGLRLPATLVFDYPNSLGLARYLVEQVGDNGASASTSMDAELDKLERMLSLTVEDYAERVRITARLETLLSALGDTHGGGDVAASEEDDIGSATDDELFELIDKELGAS